jgi:hypothetical protein
MYKCKKCEYNCENVSELGNHYKYVHQEKEDFICNKCNKLFKNRGGLSYHLKKCDGPKIKKGNKICPICNFSIANNYDKHFNCCDGRGPRRKREKNPLGSGWSKGLTKLSDDRIKKNSNSLINHYKEFGSYKHTEETKLLLSKLMNERYKNGWESTAGRCEKINYNSNIAGDIKVDGNWELRVANYLDNLGVKWFRNKKRFDYFNPIKNRKATYCPDFFVEDWNTYLEVKGYKTELDEIKWKQFDGNLEIWNKEKLNSLGIDTKYRKKK